MARRSKDWNVGLAEDLRNREFAREFLLGAIDEGVPLQVALAKVVRAMGVKEFAAKVGMASPNVLRAIHLRHNPTQDTLNRLLRPFKLRLTLAPIETPKGDEPPDAMRAVGVSRKPWATRWHQRDADHADPRLESRGEEVDSRGR